MDIDAVRIRCIVSNVRRLMPGPWNRLNANWSVISAILGYGSGQAIKVCKENNIDPDAYGIDA
jgi:hypothetical protein